jgi:hypothetical protein
MAWSCPLSSNQPVFSSFCIVDGLKPGASFDARLSPSPHLQGAILTYEDDIYYLDVKLKWKRWANRIQIYRKGHILLRIASDMVQHC